MHGESTVPKAAVARRPLQRRCMVLKNARIERLFSPMYCRDYDTPLHTY